MFAIIILIALPPVEHIIEYARQNGPGYKSI
jgi:hypothetical protein